MLRRAFVLSFATVGLTLPLMAEEATAPVTTTVTVGELVTWQPFNDPASLAKGQTKWQAGIGKWEIAEGAVRATEEAPSEKRPNGHEAVCEYVSEQGDFVMKAEFQINSAAHVGFVFRDNGQPNNHQGRIIVTPTSIELHKMSGISKTTRREVLASLKEPLAADQWHSIVIEVSGDHCRAVVDGQQTVEGRHERFLAPKGRIGVVARGDSALFKNVGIWKVNPKVK